MACLPPSAVSSRPRCVADPGDVGEQPARQQLVDEVQARAAGEQVAAVRAAVVARSQARRDVFADQRGSDRDAGAERLARSRRAIGRRPSTGERERDAGPAEARLHLVADEERAGAVAGLLHGRGERLRQRAHAAFALDRLEHHDGRVGRDRRGERGDRRWA